MVTRGDSPIPVVDVERDTGALVHALLQAPGGTTLEGASENLTLEEYLRLLCDHLGVSGKYDELPFDGTATDDSTGFKLELLQTYRFLDEFGYAGGDSTVVKADELEQRGIKVPRTKIADHIKRSDWSHIPVA